MKTANKYAALLIGWFLSSNVMAFCLLFVLISASNKPKPVTTYNVFASKPLVEGASVAGAVAGEDTRAAIIDQYYAKHNCPMTGLGTKMVETADKYGLPFWLIPSISWVESTCGKNIIENSYNAYGWGIYGNTVTKFSSWDEGIDKLGSYLLRVFYSKGTTDLCTIEKTYTPPSKGKWCKNVAYFRDEMLDFKTPTTITKK